jgi:hypothetical protein
VALGAWWRANLLAFVLCCAVRRPEYRRGGEGDKPMASMGTPAAIHFLTWATMPVVTLA